MFRMLLIIILAALLWSAAWFWGGASNKTRITSWISDQRQAGYAIGYSDLSQLGFPNRYDVTLQNPQLSAPQLGLNWQATFIQIMRLSYQPDHYIFVWPNDQQMTINDFRLDFRHQGLKASVVSRDPGQFRLSAEAGESAVSSGDRLWLKAQEWQLSIAQTANGAKVYLKLKDIEAANGTRFGEMRLLFDIMGRTLGFDGLLPQLHPTANFEISNIKLVIEGTDIPLEGWLSLGVDTGLSGQLQTAQENIQILKSLFGALWLENQLDQGLSRAGLAIIADDNAAVD